MFAHNVHPTDAELVGWRGGGMSHCPTSNSALGSGLFPLKRHVEHGVRVALGSDVGAGTGFSLFKEGLQAYFMQRLLGDEGLPLGPAHLLHLATAAGADALRPGTRSGTSGSGSGSTPCGCTPLPEGLPSTSRCGTRQCRGALAKAFALGGDTDVAGVWVGGTRVKG